MKNNQISILEASLDKGDFATVSEIVRSSAISSDDELVGMAIERLESYLFRHGTKYLYELLFLLYDRLGNEHMARFYLQYCYEDMLSNNRRSEMVYKYLSLTPKQMNGNYYEYDGDFSYIQNGEQRRYAVHSFSNSIGNNLTLLITPHGSIIFDCGANCSKKNQALITRDDLLAFLGVYKVDVSDIVAVIISHAHLDHYGSLSTLLDVGISPLRFFADPKTIDIIKAIAPKRISGVLRPISSFVGGVRGLQINSYANGHLLGSRLFVVRFDTVTVVYTGDFCVHDQHTVDGLRLNKLKRDVFVERGVGCLITESTYGQTVSSILPYKDAENALKDIISKLLKNGYKAFLPAFSIGKAQELTVMLSDSYRILTDVHSADMTHTYEMICEKKIVNKNVSYSDKNSRVDDFDSYDIIITSSGITTPSSISARYIEELTESRQPVVIIQTGRMDGNEESYSSILLEKWRNAGGLIFDIPLPTHASYDEIFEVIDCLKPENVVSIHGHGIARRVRSVADSESVATEESKAEKLIEISDNALRQKWKNAVIMGNKAMESDESIEESQGFLLSYKLLLKFAKSSQQGEEILKLLASFNSVDGLYYFLKRVFENNFIVLRSFTEAKPKPTDGILYVYKGVPICQKDNHRVVESTFTLIGVDGNEIVLTVNYCVDCKKFFIDYKAYESCKAKHKILIGNMVLRDEEKNSLLSSRVGVSPLKLCGYSVNKRNAYSKETRQYLLEKIIEFKIMPKEKLIKYLKYFISINRHRKFSETAVSKWEQDLDFLLAIDR